MAGLSRNKKRGFFRRLADLSDRFTAIRNPEKAYRNALYRDATERALQRSQFSYRNASRDRLRLQQTTIGGTGDDHLKSSDLYTLREYSRALDRDNVIAQAMLDRATESIVGGNGMVPQILSGNKRWDDTAERMFRKWHATESDIRGLAFGPELDQLAFRSHKVDGDVAFIKTGDGSLQPIEADRISSPQDLVNNDLMINGVETDAAGRPIRFWIAPQPVSTVYSHIKSDHYQPYDAKDVIFLPNLYRFSQTRGVPIFASTMQLFEDIDAFIETCIVHAKIAASHVLFISRANGPDDMGVEEVEDKDGNTRQEQVVSPGMILQGEPGEEAKMVGTTQSMQQFSPFIVQMLRFVGLNMGMPLEMLSLDFSKTTYSSARASLLVAHKSFLRQHRFMAKNYMEPIVRWKIDGWIRRGLLEDRPNGYKVTATPPRMISVDPLKESGADVTRVQHGHATNKSVCDALGQEWEDVLAQRGAEIEASIKIASKLTDKYNSDVNWRDLIGDAKNFDFRMFKSKDEPAPTGGDDDA